jgi:hypothetical protein
MDMNPVAGLGKSQQSVPIEPRKASQASASQTPPGGATDSVEFSDDARRLAAGASNAGAGNTVASYTDRIAAARQKLLSGQLTGPAIFDKTAEKLLRSGDLDKVQENADDRSAGA